MSAYFRYPVKYGGAYTLTKDDTIYLVTVNGATITLPNPSDDNLIGKLFIIKVNVEEWSTPNILNVQAGVGNTLIDNSVISLELGLYSSTSLICSTSPLGNTWFIINKTIL
jgi:hypothetical protein